LAKSSHKNRIYKPLSKEHVDKIHESNIKTWNSPENNDIRKKSRLSMIKNCFPKSQTKETKLKRVKSRSWYKHSKETIEKISLSQKGRKLTKEHIQKLKVPKKTHRINFKHLKETCDKLSKITKKNNGKLEFINQHILVNLR
jgi:hypothetical protein